MAHHVARGAALAVLALALSCGGGDRPAASASATAGPAAAPAPPAPKGRDLVGLKVCDLVPAADVGKALGGTVQLATGQPGNKYQADCMYTVRIGALSKTTQIWLYPPDQFDAMKEMETGATDAIDGLGPGAYGRNDSGVYQIVARVPDAVTLDARGDTPAQARAMADLAMEKLKAR